MDLIPRSEDPLEEGMATHSSILPGECHGQRILVGYSPWGHKESDTTKATTSQLYYLITVLSHDKDEPSCYSTV